MYIQTDKAVYKPGQKVFIRLLAVDERLRPLLNPVRDSILRPETPSPAEFVLTIQEALLFVGGLTLLF